jgi:GT2 family glycosyltransferase
VAVTWIQPQDVIPTQRGRAVVLIPVFGGHDEFVRCLSSVISHTDPATPILICDDASPDSRSPEFVRRLDETGTPHSIYYLRRERNLGFPGNVNGAFASVAPADVVILNSDCAVSAGWVEGLRDAAYSDSRVATATTLTNNGTIVSVPDRCRPRAAMPQDWSVDDAAEAIRQRSLRLHPRLPTAVGHCLYVRRSALELVGEFDLAFSPGYGEEVDFAQRCMHAGLCHVLADDVFVFHSGGASFSVNGKRSPVQDQHERMLAVRYPYYHDLIHAVADEVTGPLARSLSAARRALKGLSVTIDARELSGPITGTQVQVLEIISALARTSAVRITAIVSPDLSGQIARVLESHPEVRLRTRGEVERASVGDKADLVHRPYQINNEEDLSLLGRLGERLMVTNQDLIGYHNPSYFASYEKWDGYRHLTRSALAVADRVVFVSAHARDDALAEELLEPDRASVVHNGVDHLLGSRRSEAVAPRAADRIPADVPAILCLGTDFRHKNRIFALRLLRELRERHGWDGVLLLAGPRVTRGSSQPEEAEMLAMHRDLGGVVVDVAAVSEAEKVWLYRRASLAIYPTVHEGFGLVPFEAADHDVACLWAPGTSLAEVLPPEAAEIEPWDVQATAARVIELLRSDEARARNLSAIRRAATGVTWDAAAAKLIKLYELTCEMAATPSSALDRRMGVMQGLLSEDAVRLVGPDGALPQDLERPLLALATHPQLGRPMFGVIKAGYRASYRIRRRVRLNPRDREGGPHTT